MRSTQKSPLLPIALLLASLSGCIGSHTMLVPRGEPMLIVQTARSVHVASISGKDANGQPTWAGDNTVDIPAGYIVLPLPATRPSK